MLDFQAIRVLCLELASPYAMAGLGKGTSNRNSTVVGQLGRWTVALVQGKVLHTLPVKRLVAAYVGFDEKRETGRGKLWGKS